MTIPTKIQVIARDNGASEAQCATHGAAMRFLSNKELTGWDLRYYDEARADGREDDYSDEIVTRSAPRWAWELIDETLAADAQSKAFTSDLRETIDVAHRAMILSCERADDEPLSRADVEADG